MIVKLTVTSTEEVWGPCETVRRIVFVGGASVDAPNGCQPYMDEEKDEFEAFMAAN